MICNSCGKDNKEEARFCAICGSELKNAEGTRHTSPCSNCGFENEHNAKFCAKCGISFTRPHPESEHKDHHQAKLPKKKEKRVDTRLKWNPAIVVLLILAGVSALISIPFIEGHQPGQTVRPEPVTEQRSNDPAIEAKIRQIAEHFICSCGSCGEQPLDVCRCNTAVKEREFIRSALQSGLKEQQIIASVNSTFGWMKPEYAEPSDSLAAKVKKPVKLAVPRENGTRPFSAQSAENTRIALAADRIEIFSHFKCPCGQCGIDELKDCDCSHPRGAQEIKGYVDTQIQTGTQTVAQVITEVEQRYGGRKF